MSAVGYKRAPPIDDQDAFLDFVVPQPTPGTPNWQSTGSIMG
jgi:hypothetical protein